MKKRYILAAVLAGATLAFLACHPIDIIDLRQADFVRYMLDLAPQTKGKSTVTLDDQGNLVITLDVEVENQEDFKKSMIDLRESTRAYIKQEPLPFIVKTKNCTFQIPEK